MSKLCSLWIAAVVITTTLYAENRSPWPPRILEPAVESTVSGEDVHMVTAGFIDLDGDSHACTDWMIVDRRNGQTAWSAPCVEGTVSTHVHLGDGIWSPHLAHEKRLPGGAPFRVRVRFRDDSGDPSTEWSAWSEQNFSTRSVEALPAMVIVDVLATPPPKWQDSAGGDVILPGQSQLQLVAGDHELLSVEPMDGTANQWIDAPPVAGHHPLRLRIGNEGQVPLKLPESTLRLVDSEEREQIVYLPDMEIPPSELALFWVSANGSTHVAEPDATQPDFTRIARANPIPWTVRESGYVVEPVAEGFQLPVAIEFPAERDDSPDAPLLYVAELYGTIKVVHRDGTISVFAENLLNFDPLGNFPGAGERGIGDLAVDSESGDLYVTIPHHAVEYGGAAFQPRVLRLTSADGGRTMATSEIVLDLEQEWIGASHQISNISIGPDRRLYVHVADGVCIPCARDLRSARGKIIRVELDGSAPVDNPFYDATDGITATDLIYASGFRNPFGGAWRAVDSHLYEVENGPSTDRFVRVVPGADYGWQGRDGDMFTGALFTWRLGTAAAPVNIAFIQPESHGGSGFPPWKQDNAYVSESGPTWASGRPTAGKRIVEFVLTRAGDLGGGRRVFVEYNGTGKATVAALAAGPDGLYFSDLYKDDSTSSPVAPGARIFRVRHTGAARFEVDVEAVEGACGRVRFTDRSTIDGVSSWSWRLGDEAVSSVQHPEHLFQRCGRHTIELNVEKDGMSWSRSVVIDVREHLGRGLIGEYFENASFEGRGVRRLDSRIDFDALEPPLVFGEVPFAVRWHGWIVPRASEVHTLRLEGNAGVRLWVDGRLAIEDSEGSGEARRSRVELEAGRGTKIQLEVRVFDRKPELRFYWSSDSQAEEIVPTERLSPVERRRLTRR